MVTKYFSLPNYSMDIIKCIHLAYFNSQFEGKSGPQYNFFF